MVATIIILVLYFMRLGIAIYLHGEEEKKSKYNAWRTFAVMIISFVIYYYAGLFNHFIQ